MIEARTYFLWGEGTKEERDARLQAVKNGEEPLPDGTRYQDTDVFKVMWEIKDDVLFPYFKMSKSILDIELRTVTAADLMLPVDPTAMINKNELEVAIEGGLNAVDFTFNENRILLALSHAFDDRNFPQEFALTRPQLFRYLDPNMSEREKDRVHETLMQLSRKTFLFVMRQKLDTDPKDGKPWYQRAVMYGHIFQVAAFDQKAKEADLLNINREDQKKRFSHYVIRFSKSAFGEVGRYFRLLPSGLALEIAEFRRSKGQKPSAPELAFVEYLFQENRAVIEINFLKLADKLHIKTKRLKETARIERRARKSLDRCYETALSLKFALEILKALPAGKGITKDVIRLNPERFPYIQAEGKSW